MNVHYLEENEFRDWLDGRDLHHGSADTAVGRVVLIGLENTLCGLGLIGTQGSAACTEDLHQQFPENHGFGWVEDQNWAADIAQLLPSGVTLCLKGTEFQHKVWRGLLQIESGTRTSYGALAENLGLTKGYSQPVGTAIGRNLVSWLVPCHRVMAQDGSSPKYRWGLDVKQALLEYEGG